MTRRNKSSTYILNVMQCLVLVFAARVFATAQEFDLRVVSSAPDTVSGGDVLVEIRNPNGSRWSAELNRRDVTQYFRRPNEGNNLLALMTGLSMGKNTLRIKINGDVRSKLEMIDHPISGPIFSGPHQEPFICQTEENGLGRALDSQCNVEPLVRYYYKSNETAQVSAQQATAGEFGSQLGHFSKGFKAYDPSGPFPSDMAKTVTSEGHIVNYIVRREIGVINRAVYEIQFLHQPGEPLPTPWSPSVPGWNRRLVYDFGGGCNAGYRQGILGAVGGNPLLANGYALVTSTLNVFGNNCNERLSAETVSMVKEHFIKNYGVPIHTIGQGGSGGAIQQYLIAQNHPGLLDGITPAGSFPDTVTSVHLAVDCTLLDRAFDSSKQRWTDEQKTAVSGFATWRTCRSWVSEKLPFVPYVDPKACDHSIPKNLIYDPVNNPKGVRCDLYDNEINILGQDPRTGFARRPLDNVGVQYGLVALETGDIDAEHFVDLNEHIGGYDKDGNISATRMEADPEAIRIAYQRGLVLTGNGGLREIPIIDWDVWYSDDLADTHDHVRSLMTRARLIAANGNADNQVILVYPRPEIIPFLAPDAPSDYFSKLEERERDLVRQMDRWLDNIATDSVPGTKPEKIVRDKPVDLADSCWATNGERNFEPAEYGGPGKCNRIYPAHGDPGVAAGAPLTADVLKCSLKPVRAADYPQAISAGQFARLKAVFRQGVCDYTQPGVGQETATVRRLREVGTTRVARSVAN